MSDKSEQIEVIKKIFELARNSSRRESGRLYDMRLHGKLQGALMVVGKEYFHELKDEVYNYLQDPCTTLRAEAVRTLGWNTRLGIKEFCLKQAPEIWLHDPEEEVKIAALSAWSECYSHSKDPKMLGILYKILSSHQYSILIRVSALSEFFNVSDGWVNKLESYNKIMSMDELEDQNEFDKMIEWGHIHKIMRECVPGWSLDSKYIRE